MQKLFAGLAHLLIGFHAEDAIAIFEEQLAEKARAGADVGDNVAGAQATFCAQKIEHGRGIARAIADVVRHAIGEALFGVGKSHLHGHKSCSNVSDIEERFLTPLRSVRNDGARLQSKLSSQAGLKPGLYNCFLRELAEDAHVVLEKDLDIVDAVLEHGQAVDADAEGEAADFLGVVVYETVDGGIDHACAEEFDPGGAFAFRAGSAAGRRAGSATEGAGGVEFHARAREREIAGAKAGVHAGTEELFYEILDGAREIAEGDV